MKENKYYNFQEYLNNTKAKYCQGEGKIGHRHKD